VPIDCERMFAPCWGNVYLAFPGPISGGEARLTSSKLRSTLIVFFMGKARGGHLAPQVSDSLLRGYCNNCSGVHPTRSSNPASCFVNQILDLDHGPSPNVAEWSSRHLGNLTKYLMLFHVILRRRRTSECRK